MSNVSLEMYYFVLYDGALTLKMSKMALNAFCDKTLHIMIDFFLHFIFLLFVLYLILIIRHLQEWQTGNVAIHQSFIRPTGHMVFYS